MTKDELLDAVYPQFFPENWLSKLKLGLAFSVFPSRIRIGYVLRMESAYSFITAVDLDTYDLSLVDLHAAALANLAKLQGASIAIAKVPEGSEGWVFANDDNFAAARILLPNFQEEFSKELGPEFYVALACRDDCLCWSVNQSIERQTQHARKVFEIFREDEYNLTPDILLYCKGNFQMHLEQKFE